MTKEYASPYLIMMNDMKNEILHQLQNTEAFIKEQFRSSLDETNNKLTTLTNTVKENSFEITSIKERISKLEAETSKRG